MRNRPNRSRRGMEIAGLVRWVLLAATVGAIGVSFVLVRNRHVDEGDMILAYEQEIMQLDREIEMLELQVDARMNRDDIAGSLLRHGSVLQPVHSSRVMTIRPEATLREGAVALAD